VTGPRWPDDLLDVEALLSSGWRPVPFREFVLKMTQRCNLACDYCYVYTKEDQSWRDLPGMMAAAIRRATAVRIAEHVRKYNLSSISVILHGGEPLLLGARQLVDVADAVRAAVPRSCRVQVVVQSNGVLLDDAALTVLRGGDIRVGVSLDGPADTNNQHRRYADGRGSHAAVDRALRLLRSPTYRPVYAGLLCTIDPTVDPVTCYESLLEYEPPVLDFLLPHANWSAPPPVAAGTYGDWLMAVFDRWYGAPRRETQIRLFEEIINLILGGASRSEQVGLSPVAVVVVESDGSVEQVDSLRSTYRGATRTGVNVLDDPLDAAMTHPGVVARQIGVRALCKTCRRCPVHRVCGAGNYAHRYRSANGFFNPSVYCTDLRQLITHIGRRVSTDLARLQGQAGR
jgi:uncharacterized protein